MLAIQGIAQEQRGVLFAAFPLTAKLALEAIE